MKLTLPILLILNLLFSCTSEKTHLSAVGNIRSSEVYGDSVKNSGIIEVDALPVAMKNKETLTVRIKGRVAEVKSRTLILELKNGDTLPVILRDPSLAIPQSLKGKSVALDGFAFLDTIKEPDAASLPVSKQTRTLLRYNATGLAVIN